MSDIQDLKYKVRLAIDNPLVEVTFQQFICGILTRNIFKGAIVIATGRPHTIGMIKSRMLSGKANIFTLKPFGLEDMKELVHKMTCGNEEKCVDTPTNIVCKEIIKILENNKTAQKLAATPSICKSMLKYLSNKITNNEEIKAESLSFTVIILGILGHNMHRTYTKEEMQGFTDMVGKEDGNGLYDICKLCYQSLQDNAIQIKGQRITLGETECFQSDYGEISYVMIEKSQVFKIVRDVSGEVIISETHLRIHEFLAASREERIFLAKTLEGRSLEHHKPFC